MVGLGLGDGLGLIPTTGGDGLLPDEVLPGDGGGRLLTLGLLGLTVTNSRADRSGLGAPVGLVPGRGGEAGAPGARTGEELAGKLTGACNWGSALGRTK